METILIATDFSDASRNALFYGAKLANALGAKIILLNVYPLAFPTAGTSGIFFTQQLHQSSKQGLKDDLKWLGLKGNVQIQKYSRQGDPTHIIPSVAKEVNAHFIIAGTKGDNKLSQKIFGGTAFSLSRSTTVPLILVPESAWYKKPRVLALASDINSETDMEILHPLKKLGLRFNSTLHIVRVIKAGMNKIFERIARTARLKQYLKELNPQFQFINDNDVAHAINEFSQKSEVDMIAMISQEHNIFEKLFVKSNIEEMIIETQLPLIILPGTKAKSTHATAKKPIQTIANPSLVND
jgi:nucleotide-binding universal stress UspA family protein